MVPSGVAITLPGKPLLRGQEVKPEECVSRSKAVSLERVSSLATQTSPLLRLQLRKWK